jgi:hypothetical protein
MDGDRNLNIKHHSLTGRITLPLMHEAFRRVKRNRGAAGVDKVSINMFEANLADNLHALMVSLKRGTFQPLPTRRKYIDKGGGKLRPLGIPAVRDRVAQEVLRQLLSPLFEQLFQGTPAARAPLCVRRRHFARGLPLLHATTCSGSRVRGLQHVVAIVPRAMIAAHERHFEIF